MSFYGRHGYGTLFDAQANMIKATASGDPVAIANAQVEMANAQAAFEPPTIAPPINIMSRRGQSLGPAVSMRETAVAPVMLDHPPPLEPVPVPGPGPGLFERFGPWVWIVPAGVVAAGLGWYFIKRKSVGGYRRRRNAGPSRS